MSGAGHNSGDVISKSAQAQLQSFFARLERLDEDAQAIRQDRAEVMSEAKSAGWDPKIIRAVLRRRKMDAAKLQEEEALIDLYLTALEPLPLFERLAEVEETMSGAVDAILGKDDLFDRVRAEVIVEQRASASYLQRKFQVGYNRARAWIEALEAQGVVGPADHTGKRAVLVRLELQR